MHNILSVSFLAILVFIISVQSAPPMRFSIQKLQRSIDELWKEPAAGTRSKRIIKNRDISKEVDDPSEIWSNCKAIRIKPASRCSYLVVQDNVVKGTNLPLEKDEGIFQIEVYGISIVRLRHVTTNTYLRMNMKGQIQVTKNSSSEESLFRHILEETYKDTFASIKYYKETPYDLFIGVKNKKYLECKMKNGKRTSPDQLYNQFNLEHKGIDQSRYCRKTLG